MTAEERKELIEELEVKIQSYAPMFMNLEQSDNLSPNQKHCVQKIKETFMDMWDEIRRLQEELKQHGTTKLRL